MKKLLLLLAAFLFLCLLPTSAQIKFKPQFEAGAGFDKDNFSILNIGLALEKKIDINKSIETGIYYHTFDFNFNKDQFGFYDAFIKNTPDDQHQDSVSYYKVVFNFLSIPVGYSYYLSPRTYLNYKLGFNLFSGSTYQGFMEAASDGTESDYLFKTKFPDNVFKKFYVNHNISINRVFFRRIDLGLSFIFTKSGFFKQTDNSIYQSFDKEVSRYFAIGINMKFFVYQIDSKKI
jgi:hypothetical protein